MKNNNQLGEIYDYIVQTMETQKKLLPFTILYGDGSRWNNELKLFLTTYQHIRQITIENNICPVQSY
jgi:hypothetical protein